jgi:hypothetical protein
MELSVFALEPFTCTWIFTLCTEYIIYSLNTDKIIITVIFTEIKLIYWHEGISAFTVWTPIYVRKV